LAPCLENSTAVAFPIPEAAPVMMTVLPFILIHFKLMRKKLSQSNPNEKHII